MVPADLSLLTFLPRWLLELLFLALLVLSIGLVVLERRQPRTTWIWILAMLLLPVVGLVAYLLLGRRPYRRHARRSRKRREVIGRAQRQIVGLDRLPESLSGMERSLVRLGLHSALAPLRRVSRVELVPAGRHAFDSLVEAIEAARETIHLEFYIWRDDEAGRGIVEHLTRRARDGISVRVLHDHLGSFGLPSGHFAPLMEAGGQVAVFAPLWAPSLRRPTANFRNHRKLVSIDQRVGFVGGLNVGNEYLGFGGEPLAWEDLFVRLEGDAVAGLEAVFCQDWLVACDEAVDDEPSAGTPEPRERIDEDDGSFVQIIPSGPDAPVAEAIEAQMVAAISAALERCWIATPYLVPDEALKLALKTAALRGVDLRLLVPGKSDLPVVSLASRSYYDELLSSGCRIFELPQMLHSKYLLVDRVLAAVGSANMDIRSFHLNYEITAMFYDPGVNRSLAAIFAFDQSRSGEVRLRDRARIGVFDRGLEAVARVLSPLL